VSDVQRRVSPATFIAIGRLERECWYRVLEPGERDPVAEKRWMDGLRALMPDIDELPPGTTVHVILDRTVSP
jgi:hypothetical protein